MTRMSFDPKFEISAATAKALMEVEASRSLLSEILVVTPGMISALRESARLRSTHFSTQIEGNRLSAEEVEDVVIHGRGFPGRERDEREVLNYYKAAERMEDFAKKSLPLTELEIQALHGLVMEGKAKASIYRDGQNVIRDGATGGIVYMPPEACDVSELMGELVNWVNEQIRSEELPAPVIAALAHYQFATIHPYYDGNGRTARLLTNLILHRCGYGLSGVYSLEEYYAKNLGGYYEALTVGESHNYYMGRAECDVSGFVEYFCVGMADSFSRIAAQAKSKNLPSIDNSLLRELSALQRQALGLFHQTKIVTSNQLAEYLGVNTRKARDLCRKWKEEGFLKVEDASKKGRSYRLASKFESSVANEPTD